VCDSVTPVQLVNSWCGAWSVLVWFEAKNQSGWRILNSLYSCRVIHIAPRSASNSTCHIGHVGVQIYSSAVRRCSSHDGFLLKERMNCTVQPVDLCAPLISDRVGGGGNAIRRVRLPVRLLNRLTFDLDFYVCTGWSIKRPQYLC